MRKLTVVLLALFFTLNGFGQQSISHSYSINDGPDINPMKGWNSGWWNEVDYASVGFQYIPWKEFEPIDDTFDFAAIETILDRPGSKGKHIILRLFADWHGEQQVSDAGPTWLYSDYGVARLQATNGRYITDYNDPNYISEAVEAIEVLTAYFDNNAHIYSIQLGVLGYWGEWHTYGFDNPGYTIDSIAQITILNAYRNNLSRAQMMGRYPWNPILDSAGDIGFHNDFFGLSDHSRDFDTTVSDGSKWLDGPIGGEFPPNIPQADFDSIFGTSAGSDIIELGHYSTMQNGSSPCEIDSTSSNCIGFMDLHRKMGYNFQIASADFPELTSTLYNFDVDLELSNIGVAPMYYNWEFQFGLLDMNNNLIRKMTANSDPTTMLPGSNNMISISEGLTSVTNGDYRLGFRLIQPEADSVKIDAWDLEARNVYVVFSNDMEVIDGSWDADNKLIGGWSVLGDVEIDNSLNIDGLAAENDFRIYPNPAAHSVNFEFQSSLPTEITLSNAMGEELIKLSEIETNMSLSTTNLSNGIYFIQAFYSDGIYQQKLIVRK